MLRLLTPSTRTRRRISAHWSMSVYTLCSSRRGCWDAHLHRAILRPTPRGRPRALHFSTDRRSPPERCTFQPTVTPFKNNATGAIGGIYEKAFHYFCLHREEFLKHYHPRSNVESTFSMIKRKFGDSVRSKTDTAMVNEALAKILCHNLTCLISAMYELGID